MHILHIIDSLGLGGAERMLVDLANQTRHDGHRVSVCVTRNNLQRSEELDPTIELVVLDRQRRFQLEPLLRLAHWIRKNSVDVLHVHMRSSLALTLLLRAMWLTRRPIVFHDHYGTIEIESSIPTWFRYGNRWLSQYVGVHPSLEQWAIRAGVPSTRAQTIENRLDLKRLVTSRVFPLRRTLAIADDTLLGVLVATVRRDKGIEVAIEAISTCRHRAKLHLAIAGAQPDRSYAHDLIDKAANAGVSEQVTFLGPRHDIPEILGDADFGLLSSHTESGPLVLVEYLAASLPIVSTRVGNIGRKLDELGMTEFVPPSDPSAMANAIDRLCELSPDERERRGCRGTSVLADWDIKHVMSRWYDVYRSAIEAP